MRKLIVAILLCGVLSGCSAAETFETLGPIQHQPDFTATLAKVHLTLPESAAKQTFGGTDTVYECDNYTLVLQTFASGDLSRTVQTLSGFSLEKLSVIESAAGQNRRYDWVWTVAGEEGDMLCRAAVLDDGSYHYCIYTIAPAAEAGALADAWNAVFSSFSVEEGS